MADPAAELETELILLRTALARRLREKLEKPEGLTPAWMDQARKFLTDQGMVRSPTKLQPAPPVTEGLPFEEGDEP